MSSAQTLPSSLTDSLQQYEQALGKLSGNPEMLLSTLLARDQVETALQQAEPRRTNDVQQLIQLDEELRRQSTSQALSGLANCRQTLHPSSTAWWWFLDQKVEERRRERDLPWVVLAGTFLLFTTTLTADIIKRLWDGAPDIRSIFGTLLVLLLTGSPFSKHGQKIIQWILQRNTFLKPRLRSEIIAGLAGLAFALVMMGWLLLPQLAVWYNNQGHDALQKGDLTGAQRDFQRATAINPEQVVAYHNLGGVYARLGRPDEAVTIYQQGIEHDLNFGPAYAGLSRLYNKQGKFALAEQVSLAGLQVEYPPEQKQIELVSDYQLLSNLGWAYFGQKKHALAQQALEEAVRLESKLSKEGVGESRSPLPHYYLAQLYEKNNRKKDAETQWLDALKFLDEKNWADRPWLEVINKKLGNS